MIFFLVKPIFFEDIKTVLDGSFVGFLVIGSDDGDCSF